MARIAIPYGVLSSRQLRRLAKIAREYDRGYGHFTTGGMEDRIESTLPPVLSSWARTRATHRRSRR